MNRLDDTISDVAYMLDYLHLLKEICNSGTCNDCSRNKHCEYLPDWGKMVRYNCPFYKRMEENE